MHKNCVSSVLYTDSLLLAVYVSFAFFNMSEPLLFGDRG